MFIVFQEKFLPESQFSTTKRNQSQTSNCHDLTLPQTSAIDVAAYNSVIWKDLMVTTAQAHSIENSTTEQFKSPLWSLERKHRITASQFSRILHRKAPVTSKFVDSIYTTTSFHSAATTYGISNESTAKQKYLQLNPTHHMHSIGLVINPQFPFLAATPDARICTEMGLAIAEIKCPYSARDFTLEEACDKLPNFCLTRDNSGFHLKPTHEYWCQIQGQLMVTGAIKCVFILYTRKSLHVEDINPCSTTMQSMFDKLYNFFSEYRPATCHTENTGALELTVYSDNEE